MNPARSKLSHDKRGIDYTLLVIVILLTVIGIVTVYSAGSERSMALYGSPHAMFLQQLQRAVAGFAILLGLTFVPYPVWKKIAPVALAIAVVSLLLLFADGFAHTSKGATRWLRLGPIRFQPSELVRYSMVLFIAAYAHHMGGLMERLEQGVAIPLAITLPVAVLILIQPDFSTAFMLLVSVSMMLFIAGAKLHHLVMTITPVGIASFLIMWLSGYKRERLLTFLSPYQDPTDGGYQILQSWIGLGRGGLTGVGLGASRQKLFFLPDAHTDFIYSIVGEELGLFGTLALMFLFLVLIYRGFRIATRCPDPFGGYLAAGITFTIGIYALANMAIAVGTLPATGLPLPLISYGGTSLMLTLAALGVVLNISKYQVLKPSREKLARREG